MPVSPRGVLRNSELGSLIPNSPQSVNRALHRQKFLSMRHRVCLAASCLVHSSPLHIPQCTQQMRQELEILLWLGVLCPQLHVRLVQSNGCLPKQVMEVFC